MTSQPGGSSLHEELAHQGKKVVTAGSMGKVEPAPAWTIRRVGCVGVTPRLAAKELVERNPGDLCTHCKAWSHGSSSVRRCVERLFRTRIRNHGEFSTDGGVGHVLTPVPRCNTSVRRPPSDVLVCHAPAIVGPMRSIWPICPRLPEPDLGFRPGSVW